MAAQSVSLFPVPLSLLKEPSHPSTRPKPNPTHLLQSLAFTQLLGMQAANELRDFGDDFDGTTYTLFFDLLRAAWKDGRAEVVQQTESLLSYIMTMPEYTPQAAFEAITSDLLRAVLSRFDAALETEHTFLRELLHLLYQDFPSARPLLRALIARFLTTFINTGKKSMAVAPLLEVLGQIIKGFAAPLTDVHSRLLLALLLPLHHNDDMYEWRDQIPVIQLYHEPLVFCLTQYLERDRGAFALPIMKELLKSWPEGYRSNTPKEVLCLHEVAALLHFFSDEDFEYILPSLLPRLAHCLASDHSRCVEKALTLWKERVMVGFTTKFAPVMIRGLFSSVFRGGEMHWNVTVNKMRALVLQVLRDADSRVFAEVAGSVGGAGGARREDELREMENKEKGERKETPQVPPSSTHAYMPRAPRVAASMSFKYDAGGWNPPARGAGGQQQQQQQQQPPLTITGVAPWAMGSDSSGKGSAMGRIGQQQQNGSTGQQTPVTLTGVAPWTRGLSVELGGSASSTSGSGNKKRMIVIPPPLPPASTGGGQRRALPSSMLLEGRREGWEEGMGGVGTVLEEGGGGEEEEEGEEEATKSIEMDETKMTKRMIIEKRPLAMMSTPTTTTGATTTGRSSTSSNKNTSSSDFSSTNTASLPPDERNEGLQLVLAFMEKCRPARVAANEQSWHDLQLEPTPTLLPDMRFHDLVFGQELGSGAFSTVKYARHVVKGKTRSSWAEYAVKVIDTARIVDLGYERCVDREIAVLRVLAHPGIARMVSSFRWREGVYLVLEYASKGDLHSHLVAHGSLDEASTRFVVGEVVAALRSVHDAGFVYGDLKPENVVITESGHVKVTDFGACRPISPEAKAVLKASRHAMRQLRDGDWRRMAGEGKGGNGGGQQQQQQEQQQGGGGNDVEFLKGESEEKVASMIMDVERGGVMKAAEKEKKEEEEDDDERIEGTFAFLPPEVIREGAVPDTLADAWALGCLLYQCFTGKPPVFNEHQHEGDADIKARVVRFAEERRSSSNALFEESTGSTSSTSSSAGLVLSEDAKNLVKGLLTVERSKRLTLEAAAVHPFFTGQGIDVYELHRNPAIQLVQGSAGPTPDAAWNRRQFSAIWAPLPGNYNFVSHSYALRPIPETPLERGAPFSFENRRFHEEDGWMMPSPGNGRGLPLPPKPPGEEKKT